MKKLIYNNKSNLVKKIVEEGKIDLDENSIEILINRGVDTSEKISKFLNLSLDDIHNPMLLPDGEKACKRLIQAIKNDEEITIFTDYDVDGAMAGSIYFNGLKNLNMRVNVWTNNRFVEGYGINPLGVEHMLEKYPNTQLVITADNGIVAFDGVNACNDKNIDVIVTDHHEPNDELPNAYAIVNAKRKDSKYPFREMCGAGVAFKVMLLLYFLLDEDVDFVYDMLDMVSLATVADIVPLVDENRIFVKEGMKKVVSEDRYVFESFRKKTDVKGINSYTFGYIYAPMINALGRLVGNQFRTIEAFTSNDKEEIDTIVEELYDLNEERKKLTIEQMEICEKTLEGKDIPEVLFIYNKDFHEGVVGLIAGRLKEKYCRPTFVFTEHNGICKGSARSIDGYHIKNVLDMISDDLLGYGGHAKAGGLSISKENMELVKSKLTDIAKQMLKKEDFINKIYIDTVLNANTLTANDIENFAKFEPFGEGFSKPLFGLKNFCGLKTFYMGEEKQHFKVMGENISILGFNLAEKYREMKEPLKVKVVGYPSINIYNGKISLQFNIEGDCISKY